MRSEIKKYTDAQKLITLISIVERGGILPKWCNGDIGPLLYRLFDWDAEQLGAALEDAVGQGWIEPPGGGGQNGKMDGQTPRLR